MKHAFVTGAAGFIGSQLTDYLLSMGVHVTGWDNFSTGQRQFLNAATINPLFSLIEGDNLDFEALTQAMTGCDIVFHLAANADVRFGVNHPEKDLHQNTIATFNVLEAMRIQGIRKIVFSSTGSVYGESSVIPTPENAPFPIQTSLYAASKLACEGLIQAYCEGFGFEGLIFRFVSILGQRYTHGHVIDFYRQLKEHPEFLKVLGDGQQKKSYLDSSDCIRAIFHVLEYNATLACPDKVQIYNLGTDAYCTVTDSIRWICNTLNLKPRLEFTGGTRGWIGDVPLIYLDTTKIRSIGWSSKWTIQQSVIRTVQWHQQNEQPVNL